MMPPPDAAQAVVVDRKAALAAGDVLETPEQARVRAARKGERPLHYVPTPPRGEVGKRLKRGKRGPYR